MEINEQENTQEVQQENLLDGSQSVQAMQEENELPAAVQLVQPQAALDEIAELEKKYEEIVADADCVRIKDLKVNGGDLIKLGIKPGPQMGEILQKLLDMVIEDPEKNDREYLLDQVKQM